VHAEVCGMWLKALSISLLSALSGLLGQVGRSNMILFESSEC
jgi:hypothetical protein